MATCRVTYVLLMTYGISVTNYGFLEANTRPNQTPVLKTIAHTNAWKCKHFLIYFHHLFLQLVVRRPQKAKGLYIIIINNNNVAHIVSKAFNTVAVYSQSQTDNQCTRKRQRYYYYYYYYYCYYYYYYY